MYSDKDYIGGYIIDYSEQRALNGNPLMAISFEYGGKVGEFGFCGGGQSEQFGGNAYILMSGYGDFKGIELKLDKIEGSMFIKDEDEALELLLDKLNAAGISLEEMTLIADAIEPSPSVPRWDLPHWDFAFGKNDAENFTSEKRYVVVAPGDLWEYDISSDEWKYFG